MSSQQQFDNPFDDKDSGGSSAARNPGLFAGKKAALALGGILALGASFTVGGFVGAEIGYDNARTDIAAEEPAGSGNREVEAATESTAPDSGTNAVVAEDSVSDMESAYPVALSVGGTMEVPCAMYALEDGNCMTITLTDLDPDAACSSPYTEADRYVALSFDASMPSDIAENFLSPFTAGTWSVVNDNKQFTQVNKEFGCDLSDLTNDLMAEFPGYSASGTIWLPVQEDATEAHLKVYSENLLTVQI